MSVFELPTVTLIPNGIHHPPIEDGRLLPNSVKVSFQRWDYKGFVTFRRGGNCKGLSVLSLDEEDLYYQPLIDNPIGFGLLPEDDEGNESFKMTLTNDEGDELLVEDVWEEFSAGMFDDYLEGNLNKNDLKCQIVSEETILVPDIIKCLSDHHVSLYSADFTGVFDSSSGINGLEGITTDNQLVKVECKDNGKTILTINNEVNG